MSHAMPGAVEHSGGVVFWTVTVRSYNNVGEWRCSPVVRNLVHEVSFDGEHIIDFV